jgi:hypothetical protein
MGFPFRKQMETTESLSGVIDGAATAITYA